MALSPKTGKLVFQNNELTRVSLRISDFPNKYYDSQTMYCKTQGVHPRILIQIIVNFFFYSLKMNITDCRRMNQVLFFTSIILFVLFLSLCRRTDRVPNPSQCSRRHIHFTSRLLLCKSQWHKLDAATEHTCKSYITKQLTSISSKLSHCRYL